MLVIVGYCWLLLIIVDYCIVSYNLVCYSLVCYSLVLFITNSLLFLPFLLLSHSLTPTHSHSHSLTLSSIKVCVIEWGIVICFKCNELNFFGKWYILYYSFCFCMFVIYCCCWYVWHCGGFIVKYNHGNKHGYILVMFVGVYQQNYKKNYYY